MATITNFDQVIIDDGLQLTNSVPSTTTNKLYNNGGTLTFNGSAVNTDTDTTYTAGSGLSLVGTEFNVYGGSGQFREILIDDNFPITIKSEGNSFSSYGPDIRIGYAVAEGITSSTPSEDGNVIIGDFAASGATGNNRAVIIGRRAARNSVIGYSSILLGQEAGYSAASAQSQLIGVGISALGSTSGCSILTAIGTNAGLSSTSSSWSNFIGHNAGQNSQSVTYSNTFGRSAGQSHKAGSHNNYFGDQTGLASSGSYNIGIGRNGFLFAAGSNNIEIVTNGNSSASIIGTNDNKIHIENTIIGDTSSKLLAIGNVTSSDLTPDATLEIKPNATTDIGLIVQAVASHSASLQEWQNSSETKLLAVGPDGGLEIPSNTPSTTTNKLYNDGSNLNFGTKVIIDSTNVNTGLQYQPLGGGLNVTGLTTTEFSAATLVTESDAISSNDNDTTIPTSAAVKDYVDGQGFLTSETSHADVVVDGDFGSQGIMLRGASAGTYSILTDNSSNWNTAYGWGDHSSAGYLTAHPTISAASSSDNSGRTYIQDIILDSNGHVTGLTTATETGGSPGGSDTQIQFNDGGSFGGDADLVWNKTTNALTITGSLNATTKSFLIDHPSKPGMKLQYASLEGPENGVYVRGTTDKGFITLPDYWRDLVHNSSITVTLTPVGQFQPLFVEQKNNREITVGGVCGYYDYVVYGERKDVDKLEVEW